LIWPIVRAPDQISCRHFHDDPRNGSTLVSLNKMLSRGLPPVALHSVQSGIASAGSGARAKAGFGA